MKIVVVGDAREFATLAESWLASDPFSTNVIGVQLSGVLGGTRVAGGEDIWIVATDRGGVVGAAMHTPPFNLFLPRLPGGVASEIAKTLSTAGRSLPGVNGEVDTVAEFVHAWTALRGVDSSLVRRTRMYRLGELTFPLGTAGEARTGESDERDLVCEWFVRFRAEAAPDAPAVATAFVARRLAAGEIWLWWAGGSPVALAARSAPAGGVARVGPVYTPPAHRRCGYGSAVTARATRAALDAGANEVVLYTDLANPTSNAIYQAIGYVPDHDAEERRFVASA